MELIRQNMRPGPEGNGAAGAVAAPADGRCSTG